MSRFAPGTDLSKYEPDSLRGGRPRLKRNIKRFQDMLNRRKKRRQLRRNKIKRRLKGE